MPQAKPRLCGPPRGRTVLVGTPHHAGRSQVPETPPGRSVAQEKRNGNMREVQAGRQAQGEIKGVDSSCASWGEKRKKKKKYFPRNSPRRSLRASVSRHGLWSSALALHRPLCALASGLTPVQAPHCDALPAQGSDTARACRRAHPEAAPLWERSAPRHPAPSFIDSWRFINVGCPDGIWV